MVPSHTKYLYQVIHGWKMNQDTFVGANDEAPLRGDLDEKSGKTNVHLDISDFMHQPQPS